MSTDPRASSDHDPIAAACTSPEPTESQRRLDKPPVCGWPCSTVMSFDRGFDGYPGANRIG